MAFKLFLPCAAVFCILLSIHLTAVNGKPEPRASGCDVLYDVAEQIRDHISEPIDSLGLPPLDPFTADFVELDLQHPSLKLKGSMENVIAKDLKYFEVTACKIGMIPPKFSMSLHIPLLDVAGKYDMVGSFGSLFDLFGTGTFSILLHGLDISVTGLIAGSTQVQLKSIQLDLAFEKFEGNFEGLMDDEELGELFNELINEIAPEAFDLLWPDFKPDIEETVLVMANDILIDYTLSDALQVLSGQKNITLFPPKF